MIKSQLIRNEELSGFVGEVELKANVEDSDLQLLQYQFELASIYDALAKRFSIDDAVSVVTESVSMFLKTYKPS